MNAVVLTGVVRNGRIEVAGPIDLPDGTPVTITEVAVGEYVGGSGDGPMTPDEIARVLAAMAKIQPLEMTPEEEADREAENQTRKEWEKAHFADRAEKLRGMWE